MILEWTKAQLGRYRLERFEERYGDPADLNEHFDLINLTCEEGEYPDSMMLSPGPDGTGYLCVARDGSLFSVDDNGTATLLDPPEIRSLRKYAGLSQRAFGSRYSIPWRTIQNWEGGIREAAVYVRRLLMRCVFEDFG